MLERLGRSAVVCATGCGTARVPPAAPVPPAEWRANARQVVEQLRVDISTASVAGATVADARRALASTSDLYACSSRTRIWTAVTPW